MYIFSNNLDGKVYRLTEASVDFDLVKAAHSADGKDQTDVCVASSVEVEFPTAVMTVKSMLVIYLEG